MAFLTYRAEADPDLQQHLNPVLKMISTLVIVFRTNLSIFVETRFEIKS